ncbi:MAG: ABC transporter ATP-binding protein, partial [Phycisphaerales bacterium]
DNKPLSAFPPRVRARRIAFIEQRPDLAFDFSVERVIGFGAYAAGVDPAGTGEAMDRFELRTLKAAPYGSLSVGQQQRVSIARAWVQIARRPDSCLLADEPCSAMDPRHTLLTMHAVRELAAIGVGVGIVIHDLSIAARFADRAIVLGSRGELVREGDAHAVLTGEVLSGVFQTPILRHEIPGSHAVLTAIDPGGADGPHEAPSRDIL